MTKNNLVIYITITKLLGKEELSFAISTVVKVSNLTSM